MRARNQSPAGLQGFSCWEIQFPKRRCVGAVEVLDDLGTGTKLFCPPEATNNLVRVRVIVAYIEAPPAEAPRSSCEESSSSSQRPTQTRGGTPPHRTED
jgi:hypothetical protein